MSRRWPLVFVVTAGLLVLTAADRVKTRREGEWLQFRGDRALTGRSALKGTIRTPQIRWKHFIGGRETLLEITWDGGNGRRPIPLPRANLGVDPRPPSGGEKARTGSYQVGNFLASQSGRQKLEFESGFEKYGTSADKSLPLYGRLSARDNDGWRELWQSDPIPLLYSPNLITGDFDADGKLDAAITPWYDVWVMDVATGKVKAKARFTPDGAESGRAYGYFGAFDLDNDGKKEFVILADFENHMEVLGWRDSELAVLWSRLIERGIGNKKTIFRPGAEPVQELDGERGLEIAFSLFNATGDGRWHVIILDGISGNTKLDLPDQYLTGMRDLDGDGIAELFCTKTLGSLLPSTSDLSVLSFKAGQVAAVWRLSDAAFQTRILSQFPAHVSNGTATTGLTILAEPVAGGKLPIFFTRTSRDPFSGVGDVSAWQTGSDGKIATVAKWTGPHLEAVAVNTGSTVRLLLQAQMAGNREDHVRGFRASLKPVFSRRTGVPISTPAVARLGSTPALIAEGACERLVAFRPSGEVVWSAPGRSIRSGAVVMADLHGDGTMETVTAGYGPAGCARLSALSPDGKPLWSHDFPQIPGGPPVHNVGALTYWFAGHFTDRDREDVLVSIRRSTMHSDESFLLDGRTGRQIWHLTEGSRATGRHVRALGGSWMAVYDHDGDGLDDAAILYPDGVFVFQGKTGKTLLDRNTNKGIFPSTWAFYAVPLVSDFMGTGNRQMLYGGSAYMLALLDHKGDTIWQDGPSNGTPAILPGMGDADADGKLELLSPGHRVAANSHNQEFRCYDAATGRIRWRLPLPGSSFGANNQSYPGSPTTPAVADIDGDGREDAIFTINRSIYAVSTESDGKSGSVRWSLELPDLVGPVAVADLEGNGEAGIAVVCADGYVYGIGAANEKGRPR